MQGALGKRDFVVYISFFSSEGERSFFSLDLNSLAKSPARAMGSLRPITKKNLETWVVCLSGKGNNLVKLSEVKEHIVGLLLQSTFFSKP